VVRIWLKRLVVVVAALSVIGVAGPAEPAAASSCYTQYCGGVMTNNSSGLFYVANNWCWGDRDRWWGNILPCASTWNASAANSYFLLGRPDTTANYYWYYDTDAFRVDARCRMTAWAGTHVIFDNSTSNTPMWVKINNLSNYTVTVACA